NARIRAAWQAQVAAARKTPGLLPTLVQRRQDLLPRFAQAYDELRALPQRVQRLVQRRLGQSLGGAALLLVLGSASVQAAVIAVGGGCSLVDAITAANSDSATGGCIAGSGADTIDLPIGSTQTLTAVNNTDPYGANGLPVITSVMTIEGHGSTIS